MLKYLSKHLLILLIVGNSVNCFAQINDLNYLQKLIENGKSVINLKKSTYNIYGTLVLKDKQSLNGNGSTIIQKKASTSILDLKDKSNISISNINFVGFKNDYQPSSSSLAVGIYCWGTSNLIIKNNSFKNFSNTGIAGLRKVKNVTVSDNTFVGTGIFDARYYQKDHTGITLGGENISIFNNDISNSAQGIMIAERSDSITIKNNKIHDLPLEHGIYVDYGCSDVLIDDNIITNVEGSGIKVQNRNFSDAISKNISIINNSISNTKIGDGILVTNSEGKELFAENVLIKNNLLNKIGQHAINVRITKNTMVLNNKVSDVLHSGIYLKENYDLIIDNNQLNNIAECGIFDEGSGERIMISNNIIDKAGTNGIDKNGLNSGIFMEGGGNRTIINNHIQGYQNKMRYALYIANGDQKSIVVDNNTFLGARDYAIRLSDQKIKLKKLENNTLDASVGKSEVMNNPNK